MKKLIFVHGINNQDFTASTIEAVWSKALRTQLGPGADSWWSAIEVRTAYYADVLHAAEVDWENELRTATAMSAASPSEDYAPSEVAALYIEVQRALGVTDEEVRAFLDEDELDAPVEQMGRGIHKRWLKAITRACENVVPCAAPGLCRKFLAQAAAYLHKPGVYERINRLVKEQVFDDVAANLKQCVVVSHSLGTVVSYVLLRGMIGGRELPLFVTLGSPLGIRIIRDRIQPPYLMPPVVCEWVNGSDREDFVALYPELTGKTFGPAKIRNISDLDNGYDDPHDITKYIAQTAIASVIVEALSV